MSAAAVTPSEPSQRFLDLLDTSLRNGHLRKLVLSKYTGPDAGLERIDARPVGLRAGTHLQCVLRYATRDITRNLPLDEACAQVTHWLSSGFLRGHLLADHAQWQLSITRKGKAHLTQAASQVALAAADAAHHTEHNRAKERWVPLDRPYWTDLGLTTDQRSLVPAMARKWKQINKFVEIVAHAFDGSPLAANRAPRVVDFGSGKGYLTFALHDYLRHHGHAEAIVTGVDLRDDLVNLCQSVATRHALTGLSFIAGDVRTHQPPGMDVMIALHACDIATDHALHLGIRAGASIIVCAPCCHKQVRPQMGAPGVMAALLRHGIHMGQQAEMVTDTARALLLEACGYTTQVFEFVSLEHTQKNKMILGVRRALGDARRREATAQLHELMNFYGVKEHALEQLLRADGHLKEA